ncbi:MAG TPA: MBL fold metallo-hydrolase [Clostridia bacterium]|nr:MBL fold metallo-hydrolase [Clostridia bacterium]
MKIKWLGHACFLITSNSGAKIITDPFDDTVGYQLPDEEADIALTSHNHYDHNNIDVVKGRFVHINKPGTTTAKGITITGVATYHDESNGSKRGRNIVFKLDVDGIRVCHCGDLGHVLTADQVKAIGEVDVLLVPVGGTYTVDAAGAAQVVRQLQPAVTIPMHFKTADLRFNIDGVEKFLNLAGGRRLGRQEIELDLKALADYSGVVVLDYK